MLFSSSEVWVSIEIAQAIGATTMMEERRINFACLEAPIFKDHIEKKFQLRLFVPEFSDDRPVPIPTTWSLA